MKALLLVLAVVVLAGGGAYYFYFKDHPISWMQGPELTTEKMPGSPGSTTGGRKDFKEVSARLQSAMDRVPVNLREARQIPTYALDTRSKLAPYLQLHPEYVTITQVCDLIIDVDQAFAEHQEKCGLAPASAAAVVPGQVRVTGGPNPAVYQQRQTLWDNQRLQADSKVRQLLATLENRRL